MVAVIKQYAIPKYLYRYRSIYGPKRRTRELSALTESYVYCASYKDMNDPMEGLYQASDDLRANPVWQDLRPGIRLEKANKGIASFSETNDNELLWAHYTGGYGGVCVEYDLEALINGLEDGTEFSRLAYSDREFQVSNPSMTEAVYAVLSSKSIKWQYEREWRLFAHTVGKCSYSTNAVTAVYLGSRISKVARRELTAALTPFGIPTHDMVVKGYRITFPSSPRAGL